jgi:hypothetical protein
MTKGIAVRESADSLILARVLSPRTYAETYGGVTSPPAPSRKGRGRIWQASALMLMRIGHGHDAVADLA